MVGHDAVINDVQCASLHQLCIRECWKIASLVVLFDIKDLYGS